MPCLILVKHSEPEILPTVPPSLWRLSEAGRLKCVPLSEQLATHHPDVIIASTEPKAAETARILAGLLGMPREESEELHEHDRSNVAFSTTKQFCAAVARFFQEPQRLVMGRETADQAHLRFTRAVDAIAARHPRKTVALVTHGTVIALFVSRAMAVEPFPLWKRLGTPSFVVLSLPEPQVVTIVENI